MSETDADWLRWARETAAIAQTGLAFTRDRYDAERFEQLRKLSAEISAHHTGADHERIAALLAVDSS
ncbi:NUDIX hydrolase N-terminal domain-containing protein [Rhizobium phaseoli]|uniref:NUDIX hydrolase N-terminal domain-containing protein n=2 Tax=Rhizobium TaxID=379 RepID=A0A7X6F8R1_9HYPH|nr:MULTISPECIES: NUDIX hydrolase N-terminal domain-containing protein [Rhizobium]ANL38250.1 hypothetical protein AMC89_PD00792 [Rhizobium phaseoli]ANL44664.1 hypothetical protein AMC88_PD00822 [Rhizobium phaseoli]ANL63628.1 hypothetical protein AMC85_PD00823 [Rhizobium phaseoli]ANM01954.1 hypothetical protein AMC79_PD00789 [Rhizobium phaseoli]MDE8763820.1 NUDIX hydrolase N-terminal domain-containing protein [Rhizobium sp. CBK13]